MSHCSRFGRAVYTSAIIIMCAISTQGSLLYADAPPCTISLQSGTLNGQPLSPDKPEILVAAGDEIKGHAILTVQNTMYTKAIAPLAATPTWGDPLRDHWKIEHWVKTGITTHHADISLKAPFASGQYYIVFALAGTFNVEQIMSGTHPGWTADWEKGNRVAQQPAHVFESAMSSGSVSYSWYSPEGPKHGPMAMTAIRVIVNEHASSESEKPHHATEAADDGKPDARASFDQKATSYQDLLDQISDSASKRQSGQLADAIRAMYENINRRSSSSSRTDLQNAVLDAIQQSSPLAQRILIKAVQNGAQDRDALIINLAAATVTGGGSIAPMLFDRAITASFEVLQEEGILTEDQARLIRGTLALLQALNGLQSSDDLIGTLRSLREVHAGLVEIRVIDAEAADRQLRVTVRSGSEMLNLLIKRSE